AALADPSVILAGQTPHLIDEWQLVPDVWNAVRSAVDDRQASGQFILTGSATPTEDVTRHTGAGRFARVQMMPMSLREQGQSTGAVSLEALFNGKPFSSAGPELDLNGVAELLCRGGWPGNLNRDLSDVLNANRDYLATIAGTDIVTIDGIRRDPRKVAALLFALARNAGTYVTSRTLQGDITREGQKLASKTLDSYLDALARLWVYVEQPAWGQHMRSSAQVRRAPKRHLVDPSLAVAAMGTTPKALLADPEAFGQLFESLVFRDLSVYAQAIDARVFAYQDTTGEFDAVVVRGDQWLGIEVKLSGRPEVIDFAAAGLVHLASRMRTPPTALTVITATGPAYRRKDGVHVTSILDLGP
ncbi:MAG: uncharacterized protein QOG52_1649, partial [Frankiaceae bacterium]|nr:uncharacterized protein [Frankiaceae bacterium]